MSEEKSQPAGTLPTWALVLGVVLAAAAAMASCIKYPPAIFGALLTALTEGGMAAVVVAAAGGWGYPLVRRFAPADASLGLVVVTACLVGLWLLSTAVLVVGSLSWGLLRVWLWWPIVGGGVILAAWQGRARMEKWRRPQWWDGRALIWIVIALAAGIALAGATLPPGFASTFGDAYDVLEYHLQLPREYYAAQHVSLLGHNIYSHYPLGVEMLYLLCMCLRGGAYQGMYAANFMHGAFAALAVAAIFYALRGEQDTRARFSAAILATTPMLVYQSWLSLVELAEVAYLAAALLWLRQWMRSRGWGLAILIGAMMGGACAAKYLSVGLVVAPVAAVMFAWPAIVRRIAPLGQAAVAVLVAGLLFSPWMLRNLTATGNPVFPLASEVLEIPEHWSPECRQRWVNGHAADFKPPVPPPPGYTAPPAPTRAEMFYSNFAMSQWFGPLTKLLAAVGVCVVAASITSVEPWDWAVAAVAAMQLGVWAFFTRGMPPRFAAPVTVPLALLAGYLLARLGSIQTNPFRKHAARPSYGPWGMSLAVAFLVAATAINLLVCRGVYGQAGGFAADGTLVAPPPVHGLPGTDIAKRASPWSAAAALPAGSTILLVGEAKAFYFPPVTIYATVFNSQPLDELIRAGLTPPDILAHLRGMGVTHLWFDWSEIVRLADTYGFPSSLSAELVERLDHEQPPSLAIVRELEALGMTEAATVEFPLPASQPASSPASQPATAPTTGRAPWPLVTVYALPTSAADSTTQPAYTSPR